MPVVMRFARLLEIRRRGIQLFVGEYGIPESTDDNSMDESIRAQAVTGIEWYRAYPLRWVLLYDGLA